MTPRPDPRLLYLAYGASSDMRTFDGRPMPPWEALGPNVQAHWTIAALQATGLDMAAGRIDPGFAALAQLMAEDGPGAAKVPPQGEAAAIYWHLRTWGRLAAAVANFEIGQRNDALLAIPRGEGADRTFTTPPVGALATVLLELAVLAPGELAFVTADLSRAAALIGEVRVVAMAAINLRIPSTPELRLEVAALLDRVGAAYGRLADDGQAHPLGRLFSALAQQTRGPR
jgi:hypothetical protein